MYVCTQIYAFRVFFVLPRTLFPTLPALPSSCRTPQLTLVLAGGGYLAFLILFLPLYAISFIVTAAGAWAVLVGTVYLGGNGLTHMISYPGSSKQIQRDLELEYTKSVSSRLVSGTGSRVARCWRREGRGGGEGMTILHAIIVVEG